MFPSLIPHIIIVHVSVIHRLYYSDDEDAADGDVSKYFVLNCGLFVIRSVSFFSLVSTSNSRSQP